MLALEMGTGKTIVALSVMLASGAQMVLICCPLRVIRDAWVEQIGIHLAVPVEIAALDDGAGTSAKRASKAEKAMAMAQARRRPLVVIVNYEAVHTKALGDWIQAQQWDLTVLDESHKIKAPGGTASMFLKRLRPKVRQRLLLSGTPMPHSPLDIYAQFRFLNPSIFGTSYTAFRNEYAILQGIGQKARDRHGRGFEIQKVVGMRNLADLEEKMRPVTFRVPKSVLDLPPEMETTLYCELGPDAQGFYNDLEKHLITEILGGEVTAANAMVKILRLQQLTSGYLKTDDGRIIHVDRAKAALLEDVLEDIESNEPVVIFCRFHTDLDQIHEVSKKLDRESLELSGRRDELAPWKAGKAPILAVQESAGGIGVDLTRSRYAMFYSLTLSLGDYKQARARVHRPGQTRPVQYIHLAAKGTVDQKITKALLRRDEVIESVLKEFNHA